MSDLALNNVYYDIFKLLWLRYHEAVVNLRIADYNVAVSRGLAAHIIRAYARGLATFHEPDNIIGAFADYASPALLGNAIHAAGNSLQRRIRTSWHLRRARHACRLVTLRRRA